MGLKESLEDSVSLYMSKEFAQVADDEFVSHAAKAMLEKSSTEAVVMKGKVPVGMITERDILWKVVATDSSPQRTRTKDVMSAPLETIDASARVGEAISKMSKLGLRRLVVTKNGEVVGIITQKAVVSGSRGQSVPLPELAKPTGLSCPYCGAVVKNPDELSKHIDQVHLGLGLLEGDVTKY